MINKVKCAGAMAAAALIFMQFPASDARANSPEFGDNLARNYDALSAVESAQGDSLDAKTYAERAAAARGGAPTNPAPVESRAPYLKPHYVTELAEARARLMSAFEKEARAKAPAAAARAQSSFDCWLEQATEDLQPQHIDACKQAYLVAVADVEKALVPPPPPPVDPDSDGDGVPDSRDDCPGTAPGTPVDDRGCPQIPDLQGVHFNHDKAVLTAAARTILDDVVGIIRNNPHVRLEIVGHTDSTGSDDYNVRLSQRRADAVKAYLGETGVSMDVMSVDARGESQPIADNATAEGRAANRRVEIIARPR